MLCSISRPVVDGKILEIIQQRARLVVEASPLGPQGKTDIRGIAHPEIHSASVYPDVDQRVHLDVREDQRVKHGAPVSRLV